MTGFNSKREAAADKFIAAEERKVGERYGYVPKLHPSEWIGEPAQEPSSEWAGIKAILDEYGLQAIDFVADFKAALAQPPLPVQPERPWVGLTDADIENCIHVIEKKGINVFDLAKVIEAKLEEKNNGT